MIEVELASDEALALRAKVDGMKDDETTQDMAKTVDNILNEFYGRRGIAENQIKADLDKMDLTREYENTKRQYRKDLLYLEKFNALEGDKSLMDLDLKEQVLKMREAYEVDIWNQMSDMAIQGLFVEDQMDDPVEWDFYCSQYSTYGNCIEWTSNQDYQEGWPDAVAGSEYGPNPGQEDENQFCYCSNYTGNNAVPQFTYCPPGANTLDAVYCDGGP
jgi:hypothetical protein